MLGRRDPDCPAQHLDRNLFEIADRAYPEAVKRLGGALADPPEHRDRQRPQKGQHIGDRDEQQAVRFATR